MNAVILLAALLGADAAPPADPKLPVIERILPRPAESLRGIEDAIDVLLDGGEEKAGLPKGWKKEYLRLWKAHGVAKMRAAVTKHLRENFTLRELKALEAMKGGDIHPLDEKGQRRLQEKIEAYAKFAQEVGAKVGAEMGERAESNLKETF